MRRAAVLRLRVRRATIRAEAVTSREVLWAAEATYESAADLGDAIARLAAEPPVPCRRATVALEQPPAQLRILTGLPPVKSRALAALVDHQAARYFRRNGAPLVTDAVWVKEGREPVAFAAAVEEPLVEAIVAGALAAGLVVESIEPAEARAPLLLLPGAERAARARREFVFMRRLAVIAAALWVAAIAAFLVRLQLERRATDGELRVLQQPLAAVIQARRTMRVAAGTVDAVNQAQRARGRSLVVLAAVSAALPDSAVLTSLSWSADSSGVLTGLAQRAADMLARLERSGAVLAPRFEGPIVKEVVAGREWERFTVVFGPPKGARRGPSTP